MDQIMATALKDLMILRRDAGTLAILFLMPMVFILVMSLAFSNVGAPANVAPPVLLVVNEDTGEFGAQLVAELATQYSGQIVTEQRDEPLTQRHVEELLRRQQGQAAALIPANFSTTVNAPTTDTATAITLLVDPALATQERYVMRRTLDSVLQQLLTPAVVVVEASPVGMAAVLPDSAVARNVPAYTIFGIFFIVQYIAASILDERRLGTLQRILVAPVRGASLLAGKLFGALLVNLIQIVVMFATGMLLLPLFGAPSLDLGTDLMGLVLVSLVTSLTAGGLGLLLAAVVRNYEQISGLGLILVLPMAVLGGVMVPREQLPTFMRNIGLFSPHTWALEAYEDLLVYRGDMITILPEIGILSIFAVVFYSLAMLHFRRSARATR